MSEFKIYHSLNGHGCIVHSYSIEEVDAEIAELKAENERLKSQLPESMEECKIIFKECSVGHGELSATNWKQHDCVWCEIENLKAKIAKMHKDYGCEMRDPNGTIWEYAGKLQTENDGLRKKIADIGAVVEKFDITKLAWNGMNKIKSILEGEGGKV